MLDTATSFRTTSQLIVREFQRDMIGEETRAQMQELNSACRMAVIICVSDGSNVIEMFVNFIDESDMRLIGVELDCLNIETGQHNVSLKHGATGIYFGMKLPMMQSGDG